METLQNILVALIVIACALYSAWRLTSVSFHLRMLEVLGSGHARADSLLARLRARELSKLGGACGTCSSNGKVKVHGLGPNRTPGAPRR